ncbi:hypothetical protein C7S16_4239 [Burkholderia thailandensis]|uniref:Uncharacterized protein n=1 Tax=Burkholderia thailandensis TaxID=57975 RepID=A0AAW9CMH8_BURTH|nr:hypothetical protein [Burkholderia thailandensis]
MRLSAVTTLNRQVAVACGTARARAVQRAGRARSHGVPHGARHASRASRRADLDRADSRRDGHRLAASFAPPRRLLIASRFITNRELLLCVLRARFV